jgi:hypothetical protein
MKALVEVTTTTDGSYGLHGDWHWDALPYWDTYPAWIVKVQVTGAFQWGPVKLRSNAHRTHSGESLVRLTECRILYSSREEAEEEALQAALKLEERGFLVDLCSRENHQRQDLRSALEWLDNKPAERLRKRLRPELANLLARTS